MAGVLLRDRGLRRRHGDLGRGEPRDVIQVRSVLSGDYVLSLEPLFGIWIRQKKINKEPERTLKNVPDLRI